MESPSNSLHRFTQEANFSGPFLRIIVPPVEKYRFRYKSEMSGTHGKLYGQNIECYQKQTYPTVELCNYTGNAIVRCTLFQHGTDTQPHAHLLMKNVGNKDFSDPHKIEVSRERGYIACFHSLGIVYTAKNNILAELVRKITLMKKEEIACKEKKIRDLTAQEKDVVWQIAEAERKSINLNIVCLRFDAHEIRNGINHPICAPIYSESIYNQKSVLTCDLKIVRMNKCSSPSEGGQEIFILVEKVTKKNIKVRFFDFNDKGEKQIFGEGKFTDLDVHHQYAIVFKTPPYRNINTEKQVSVFMELYRPSDGACSEPSAFTYTPSKIKCNRKRMCTSTISSFPSGNEVMHENKQLENVLVGNPLSNETDEAFDSYFGREIESIIVNQLDSTSLSAAGIRHENFDLQRLNSIVESSVEITETKLTNFFKTEAPHECIPLCCNCH